MKKITAIILTFTMLLFVTSNVFAETLYLTYDGAVHKYTGAAYKLKINGEIISTDMPPVIINDRALVPARAIFEKLGAAVNWDAKTKKVAVTLKDTKVELVINAVNAMVNDKAVKLDVPAKIINNRTLVPIRFISEQLNLKVGWLPNQGLITVDNNMPSNYGVLKDIVHSKNISEEIVSIVLDSYENYKVIELTSPERIVIDIPNTKVTSKQSISINGSLLTSIRSAQFDESTARVVLDVTKRPKYEVVKKEGEIAIKMANDSESSTGNTGSQDLPDRGEIDREPQTGGSEVVNNLKNINYYNKTDRVHFILNAAKLTEGGENLKKLYSEKIEADGKKYTITFSSSQANLENGKMEINDNLLQNIEVIKNISRNETSIIFNAKDKLAYEIITRPEVNNTAITVLKPALSGTKLVVIDPGHGGTEPGAIYNGVFEKDLNLNIALKLNKLLKSKNIDTYMIREDDSFVGLYERAYIANNLNATLFLSIHNNAYYSEFSGTETLYYPNRLNTNGFSGKRFAQIIQDALLGKLNTFDRKIKERPNLVVLKATVMPSALAEIAFMTNKQDMENLKTEAFKQKAAEALCDSIIKALSEIK